MSKTTKRRRSGYQRPESELSKNLILFSKSNDIRSAISLFNDTVCTKTHISQNHFNILLHLCSVAVTDPITKSFALDNGFRIFDNMISAGVRPSEASITAVARLAAAKGDGDHAFELVKGLGMYGITPRGRTYGPALSFFCESLELEKAYEVEAHMRSMGLNLEEHDLVMLLIASVKTGMKGRVYEYFQKLRSRVRHIKEETARLIEDNMSKGFAVDGIDMDPGLVREEVLKNGGGWHGIGWIGKGRWIPRRVEIGEDGDCLCGEHLACVDIGDMETENFASSLAELALEREVHANFSRFMDWIGEHNFYPAVVDAANVGLYQQNFSEGEFSISQLDAIVKCMHSQNRGKWPLVILHKKRLETLKENPSHRHLIEEWIKSDHLYSTPPGSNDDWYWLYAAVKLRCLLVTNDEMRDHNFELLGDSIFHTWKERHQVRYSFVKGTLEIQMPRPFSEVIQESVKGTWHLPIRNGNEKPAQGWLCIKREEDKFDVTN